MKHQADTIRDLLVKITEHLAFKETDLYFSGVEKEPKQS